MMKIILILLAIVYALSPYDILPDFFLGWGWIDDIIILYLLWRYVFSPHKKGFDFSKYYRQRRGAYGQSSTSANQSGWRSETSPEDSEEHRDPYAILGVHKGASSDEIQKAYKQLVNRYHPDKVQHLGEEFRQLAEKRFKEIQQAYQYLVKE